VTIKSSCAHCERSIKIELSDEMQFTTQPEAANPLVFLPHVDWETFTEPNIIHRF